MVILFMERSLQNNNKMVETEARVRELMSDYLISGDLGHFVKKINEYWKEVNSLAPFTSNNRGVKKTW